jgi:hypothetical protein
MIPQELKKGKLYKFKLPESWHVKYPEIYNQVNELVMLYLGRTNKDRFKFLIEDQIRIVSLSTLKKFVCSA